MWNRVELQNLVLKLCVLCVVFTKPIKQVPCEAYIVTPKVRRQSESHQVHIRTVLSFEKFPNGRIINLRKYQVKLCVQLFQKIMKCLVFFKGVGEEVLLCLEVRFLSAQKTLKLYDFFCGRFYLLNVLFVQVLFESQNVVKRLAHLRNL